MRLLRETLVFKKGKMSVGTKTANVSGLREQHVVDGNSLVLPQPLPPLRNKVPVVGRGKFCSHRAKKASDQ